MESSSSSGGQEVSLDPRVVQGRAFMKESKFEDAIALFASFLQSQCVYFLVTSDSCLIFLFVELANLVK